MQLIMESFSKTVISLLILFTVTFHSNRSFAITETENEIRQAGDIIQYLNLGYAALLTVVKKDPNGSLQLMGTSLATLGLTFFAKNAFNNVKLFGNRLGERPNKGDLNFPSGHSSNAISAAWFVHKRYGIEYSAVPLALGVFTAYSRVQSQRHDVIAVIAGGLLGIGVAELFTSKYKKGEKFILSINSLSTDEISLSLRYNF